MSKKHLVVAAALLAAGTTIVAAQRGTSESPGVLLKAAANRELVDGDLSAAIKAYQAIVDKYEKTDKATAAAALLRMAGVYQKQGDVQARAIYERIVRQFGDQAAATEARTRLSAIPASPATRAPSTRQLWTPSGFTFGTISPDGRYLSVTDWSTGDLALHDFTTGQNRRLTNKGPFTQSSDYADFSAISRDGTQVAYAWANAAKGNYELRILPVGERVDATPRVLFENPIKGYIAVYDWSPDGKWIALWLNAATGTQIALVDTRSGKHTVLKSFDWRPIPQRMTFSPDSTLLAYDLVVDDLSGNRDVFVLSVDGSRWNPVVAHPAMDLEVGWAPDNTLLFTSDRSGPPALFAQRFVDGRPEGPPARVSTNLGSSPRSLGITQSGSLVFVQQTGAQKIYAAEVDFSTGQLVAAPQEAATTYLESQSNPTWSWDGRSLAYSSGATISIQSLETGRTKEVRPALRGFRCFQWAPDGSLTCHGFDFKGRHGIYRVDTGNGNVTPIVIADEGYRIVPTWSSDGKQLVYLRNHPDVMTIVVRDMASGRDRDLMRVESFHGFGGVSPDGRYVAYITNDPATKTQRLYVIATEGGSPRELFSMGAPRTIGGGLKPVEWTPDSHNIVVLQSENGSTTALVISLAGGSPRPIDRALSKLTQNGLRIHPNGRRIAYSAGTERHEIWALENFLPPSPASSSRR